MNVAQKVRVWSAVGVSVLLAISVLAIDNLATNPEVSNPGGISLYDMSAIKSWIGFALICLIADGILAGFTIFRMFKPVAPKQSANPGGWLATTAPSPWPGPGGWVARSSQPVPDYSPPPQTRPDAPGPPLAEGEYGRPYSQPVYLYPPATGQGQPYGSEPRQKK